MLDLFQQKNPKKQQYCPAGNNMVLYNKKAFKADDQP
jgi:hypothetical protein